MSPTSYRAAPSRDILSSVPLVPTELVYHILRRMSTVFPISKNKKVLQHQIYKCKVQSTHKVQFSNYISPKRNRKSCIFQITIAPAKAKFRRIRIKTNALRQNPMPTRPNHTHNFVVFPNYCYAMIAFL